MAAKRTAGTIGRFEPAALALGTLAAAWFGWIGWLGAQSPKGVVDGLPAQIAWIFGAVALLAVFSDLRVVRAGGIKGKDRTVRHLWRMGVALFVVWGSFAGQPVAQPEPIRNSPWLFLPALAALGLMVFWWLKTRLRRRPARAVATA